MDNLRVHLEDAFSKAMQDASVPHQPIDLNATETGTSNFGSPHARNKGASDGSKRESDISSCFNQDSKPTLMPVYRPTSSKLDNSAQLFKDKKSRLLTAKLGFKPSEVRSAFAAQDPLSGAEDWPSRYRIILVADPCLFHYLPVFGISYSILPEMILYVKDLKWNRDGSLSFSERVSQLIADNGWFCHKVGNSTIRPQGSSKLRAAAWRACHKGWQKRLLKPVHHVESKEHFKKRNTSDVSDDMHVIIRFPESIVNSDELCWEANCKSAPSRLYIKPRLARALIKVSECEFDTNVKVLHQREYFKSMERYHEILDINGNLDITANHVKDNRAYHVRYMFRDSEEKWEQWKLERSEDEHDKYEKELQHYFTKGFELPDKELIIQYSHNVAKNKKLFCCLCGKEKPHIKVNRFDYFTKFGRFKHRLEDFFDESSDVQYNGEHYGPQYCYAPRCRTGTVVGQKKLKQYGIFLQPPVRPMCWPTLPPPHSISYQQYDRYALESMTVPKYPTWNWLNRSSPPAEWRCTTFTPCPLCHAGLLTTGYWRVKSMGNCPLLSSEREKPQVVGISDSLLTLPIAEVDDAGLAELPFASLAREELLQELGVASKRRTSSLNELPFASVQEYDLSIEFGLVSKGKGKAWHNDSGLSLITDYDGELMDSESFRSTRSRLKTDSIGLLVQSFKTAKQS